MQVAHGDTTKVLPCALAINKRTHRHVAGLLWWQDTEAENAPEARINYDFRLELLDGRKKR